MLYIFLAFGCALLIYDFILHHTRSGRLLNKFPGPKPLPIIGNASVIWGLKPVPLFQSARRLANEYKNISRLWLGPFRVLNLYDPDDIEVVLSSPKYIEKGYVTKFLSPWLNNGLLTSGGDRWKSRRKILVPTFHFNILKQFCGVFVEQSNILVEKLQSEVGKDETAILPFITNFTINTICETAMGINLDSTDSSTVKNYKKAIYELGNFVVHRVTTIWYHVDFIWNLTPSKRKQDEIIKVLHKFTQDVIDERRKSKKIIAEAYNNQDNYMTGSKKRLALLDLLLMEEDKGLIDNAGIKEEVDTFMFEGHDTATMSLTLTLMLLANHPKIQDKIVAEVDEIVWDANSITIEELNKMQYLDRCIKEALRFYPTAPFINRDISEDIKLKNYVIPAGTLCNIFPFDLHRKADLFPDPEKYDPDRFLPENCLKRHPFAYIPFSAGPRNCIGQKFAILEEKVVIAAILKHFKLEAVTRPEDVIFSADIILRSDTPIKIKFTARS